MTSSSTSTVSKRARQVVMDSRRISAALGFTLLIACVIGVIILIHNSGSTRMTSHQNLGTDHIISWNAKDGFANDPNYHSSQPTMQEVNELADELHRLLSSKAKVVKGSKAPVMVSAVANGKQRRNGTVDGQKSSVVTKASISAINYSIVSKQQKPHGGVLPGGLPPSTVATKPSSSPLPPPSSTSSLQILNTSGKEKAQQQFEIQPRHRGEPPHQQQQQQRHQYHGGSRNPTSHNQHQYPGQHSPPPESADTEPIRSSSSGKERGGSHDDLYTMSWLPSMISPGVLPSNKQQYHHQQQQHQHHRHNQRHPHTTINEELDGAKESTLPLPSISPGLLPIKHVHSGKESSSSFKRNHHHPMATWQQQKQPLGPPYNHNSPQREDEDFLEYDLSEEESDDWDGNDVETDNNNAAHPGDEEEEEEDEEEDDYEDAEPKNFSAELETLLDLANHLYTSGANGSAFQGFLKVVNETIQRSNNSRLLVELNEKYGRSNGISDAPNTSTRGNNNSSTISNFHSELFQKRSPYESSLTAFVFMSFGVFLLNQIHSFVQKANISPSGPGNNSIASGRALEELDHWYHLPQQPPLLLTKEASSLDILFQPPPPSSSGLSGGDTHKLERQLHHNESLVLVAAPAGKEMDNDTSYESISLSNAAATATTSFPTTINSGATNNTASGGGGGGSSFHNGTTPQNNNPRGEEKGSASLSGSEESSGSARMIMPFVQHPDHLGGTAERLDSYPPPATSSSHPGQSNNTGDDDDDDEWSRTSGAGAGGSSPRTYEDNSFSSTHVNNMFRALLNIVNAYTKNSPALECIWSLYCQDLDKTAGKQGLYGVAARINSVGLRLIMNQIPPSLTMDVILRSLVGWDGLPCQKMFPKCETENGTILMVNETTKVSTNML